MDAEKRVTEYIAEHEKELCDALASLIAVNSENFNGLGDETECAKRVAELYESIGLSPCTYFPDDYLHDHPSYLPGRNTDRRPNVAAVYGDCERRIMLAAHTDTVPIGDEAGWSVPPLSGVIDDGRLFGRGSGDNKFGLAAGWFALKAIMDCGIKLKSGVVLSAYCDEEYGGGNGSIASCVKYPCDVYISLDSGNGDVWVSSIGGQALAVELKARESQDSAALIVDAMYWIKGELEKFGRRRYLEFNDDKYYRGTDMQRSCLRFTGFSCGYAGCDLDRGRIDLSIYTAKSREDTWAELTEIEERAKEKFDAMGIDFAGFTQVSRYFDYEAADDDDPAVKLMQRCASEVTGREVPTAGACLSDYFLYLQYGSRSSFGYGILRDFMLYGGSHQPDEFIYVKDLVDCTKALALYLLRWCGCED